MNFAEKSATHKNLHTCQVNDAFEVKCELFDNCIADTSISTSYLEIAIFIYWI